MRPLGRTSQEAPARVGSVLRAAVARLAAAGIATARQDAELLLARVLGATRLALHLGSQRELAAAPLAGFEELVTRRTRHEPLQYLLGDTGFCGLELAVGPGVFIPRPETELLVERALAAAPRGPGVAVDLCAGSGAVACALAARHASLVVWAVELLPAAAVWARENIRRLGLGARVSVLEGDLFAPLADSDVAGRCDLVVANPPYIGHDDLATLPEEVRAWEPLTALDGGFDGTAVIARILSQAPDFLRPGGTLLLEMGHDQAERIRRRIAAEASYARPEVYRDLLGRERVLAVRRV